MQAKRRSSSSRSPGTFRVAQSQPLFRKRRVKSQPRPLYRGGRLAVRHVVSPAPPAPRPPVVIADKPKASAAVSTARTHQFYRCKGDAASRATTGPAVDSKTVPTKSASPAVVRDPNLGTSVVEGRIGFGKRAGLSANDVPCADRARSAARQSARSAKLRCRGRSDAGASVASERRRLKTVAARHSFFTFRISLPARKDGFVRSVGDLDVLSGIRRGDKSNIQQIRLHFIAAIRTDFFPASGGAGLPALLACL